MIIQLDTNNITDEDIKILSPIINRGRNEKQRERNKKQDTNKQNNCKDLQIIANNSACDDNEATKPHVDINKIEDVDINIDTNAENDIVELFNTKVYDPETFMIRRDWDNMLWKDVPQFVKDEICQYWPHPNKMNDKSIQNKMFIQARDIGKNL